VLYAGIPKFRNLGNSQWVDSKKISPEIRGSCRFSLNQFQETKKNEAPSRINGSTFSHTLNCRPGHNVSFWMTHRAVVYGMCVWSTATFFLCSRNEKRLTIDMPTTCGSTWFHRFELLAPGTSTTVTGGPASLQWEFQDPKMEVLYHIRPYSVGIFPYIALT